MDRAHLWSRLALTSPPERHAQLAEALSALAGRDASLAVALSVWLEAAARGRSAPLRVGVHGPQGSGKSTLCELVVAGLGALGLRAATVSIDDFYLDHEAQRALAARHADDPCLEHRGYPGTHDVALGERVLGALATSTRSVVEVPRYDKSAHGGRGDRHPASRWLRVETPLDVALLEGWMLGFVPCPMANEVASGALVVPDGMLAAYAPWRRWVERWVVLELAGDDLEPIVRWRVDAERARRRAGQPGLDDAQAEDYVRRFLPAYRLWSVPTSLEGVRVALDPDRSVVDVRRTPAL